MGLHVLDHAQKEPSYVVEIMVELSSHSKNRPGSLYPLLHQLQEDGLISSDDQVVDGKRRKNLRITPAGRKLLRAARAQLRELAAEILDDQDGRELRRKK